jgi:hypothetical protein
MRELFGRGTTAQESFKTMMRDEIAPALRELGFKGSGQRFELPNQDFWALLGFQKSVWSDSAELRFTINVTVASRAAWAAARKSRTYLPERPSANTYYGDFTWQARIGQLAPTKADLWWTVKGGKSTRAVADEVVAAIRERALPALQRERNAREGEA